jgi:hypothetical protein
MLKFFDTARTKPWEPLLQIALFWGLLGLVYWRYTLRLGDTPFTEQSHVGQQLRKMLGIMVLFTPYILAMAGICWVMHYYRRPTHARMNRWTVGLLLFFPLGLFLASLLEIEDLELAVISLGTTGTQVLFLCNIISSLVRRRGA